MASQPQSDLSLMENVFFVFFLHLMLAQLRCWSYLFDRKSKISNETSGQTMTVNGGWISKMPDGTFDTDANDTIHWCRTKSCIFWEKHPRKVWGEEGCPQHTFSKYSLYIREDLHLFNLPWPPFRPPIAFQLPHDLPQYLPRPFIATGWKNFDGWMGLDQFDQSES